MYTAAGFTLGQPGDLRKTFDDGVFDLQGGAYSKFPCRLADGVDPVAVVKDGLFISPSNVAADAGRFVASPDAARACYMVFTANTQVIVRNLPTPPFSAGDLAAIAADPYPGEERTDTPTGMMGKIEGIWPAALLDAGNPIGAYVEGTALSIVNGKLAVAGAGARVIGYVTASAATLGQAAIAASITL